ncbi:hypothetical protein DFR86_09940 [Acidianus sulfidivorans JP7]|uniref:Uncharacterized protein n=1 Tax=Acidianus sulfidivorans JP7 TaxID=619593 RepID=A0A2U9IP97_9CREN|nr:hypothetical protein [Acidianus sulfidivorans]AWR97832.1 hypothetical protein DFR86_09940 [Acidianus sulfidivorans JP7]
MAKKRKSLIKLNRTLLPIQDQTLEKYRKLYIQYKQQTNAKDIGDFISQILETIYPLISSKDLQSLNAAEIIENLKNSGYYIIPVQQDIVKKYNIFDEKFVDTFLSNYSPRNLIDGIKMFLNLHTSGATVIPKKEGICEEIQITFKFKPDKELEQILAQYIEKLITKLNYQIREYKDTDGNLKFLCCK